MNFIYWALIGICIVGINFLLRRLYTRFLQRMSANAVSFGKRWGQTTNRFKVLRVLNSFFYIIGLAVTLASLMYGIIMLVSHFQDDPPVNEPEQVVVDEVLDARTLFGIVNTTRESHGLHPLVWDNRLQGIAQARANDMVEQEYYAHRSPDGTYYYDFFPEFNIKTDYSCENLDVEFTLDENRYVQDWLKSNKGHKECMLHEDTTSAGYAVATFGDEGTTKVYLVVAIHTTGIETTRAADEPAQ